MPAGVRPGRPGRGGAPGARLDALLLPGQRAPSAAQLAAPRPGRAVPARGAHQGLRRPRLLAQRRHGGRGHHRRLGGRLDGAAASAGLPCNV